MPRRGHGIHERVAVSYPYTHSIPHPPPIVNYFFKKNYLSSKKNACHARGKESMFIGRPVRFSSRSIISIS